MVVGRRLVSFARPPWRLNCGSMDNECVLREGRSDRTRSRDNDRTSTAGAELRSSSRNMGISFVIFYWWVVRWGRSPLQPGVASWVVVVARL